jgi:hypothetical protein
VIQLAERIPKVGLNHICGRLQVDGFNT